MHIKINQSYLLPGIYSGIIEKNKTFQDYKICSEGIYLRGSRKENVHGWNCKCYKCGHELFLIDWKIRKRIQHKTMYCSMCSSKRFKRCIDTVFKVGKKIGNMMILEYTNKRRTALARCSCGNIESVSRTRMLKASKLPLQCKSCLSKRLHEAPKFLKSSKNLEKDFSGQVFGSFRVMKLSSEHVNIYWANGKIRSKKRLWEVECTCGKILTRTTQALMRLQSIHGVLDIQKTRCTHHSTDLMHSTK